MSKFSQPKPAGQPPSLRNIAESQADGSNFPEERAVEPQSGTPAGTPGAAGTYKDPAEPSYGKGGQNPSRKPF